MALKLWERTKAAYNAFTVIKLTPTEETDTGSTITNLTPAASKMIPVVYSAINMLAYTIAPLPKIVERVVDRRDDYAEPVMEHPINDLLEEPSPYMDGNLFWSASVWQLLTNGNLYYQIKRGSNDRPISLLPGQVNEVIGRLSHGPSVMFSPWLVADGRFTYPVPRRDIIAVHGPGFDGYLSPSPIMNVAFPTLQALSSGLQHQNSRFKAGLNSQMYIGTDVSLEGIDVKQLQDKADELLQSYRAVRDSGRVPVMPPGYSLKSVGTISSVDLQIIDLLRWAIEDIARVYNYNPYMLTALSGGQSFPKSSELADYFARWTLPPPINIMKRAISRKLLSRDDRMNNYRIAFADDTVRTGTWLEQVTAADLAATRGAVLTVNEVRQRRLGYGPIEGGDKLRSPKGSPVDGENKE